MSGYKTYIFTLAFVVSLIGLVAAHYYFKDIFELMPLELVVGTYSLLLGAIIASLRAGIKHDASEAAVVVKDELQMEVARIIDTIMKESFNQHLATKKVVEEVKEDIKEDVRKEVASIKNGQGNMG